MAKTSNNLCCLIISVIDDSNPDGLKIRIYYNREEDRPVLQTYCLVLCQEMRVRLFFFSIIKLKSIF